MQCMVIGTFLIRLELDLILGVASAAFQVNRGPNEEINGQTVYDTVRLYRRYTPAGRGHFHCELPNAAGVNQILYVNICEF